MEANRTRFQSNESPVMETDVQTDIQKELPLLDENELAKVAEGKTPLPQSVDEHIAVDNKLIDTIDESRQQAIARVPGDSKRACASGPIVNATVVSESRRVSSTVSPDVENVAVWPLMRAPGAWPVWTVVMPT
jgi:hypothetical protein